MARKGKNINLKFGVIMKEGHETWTSIIDFPATNKVSELANAIRIGIQAVNPPDKRNIVFCLTKLYYPKKHRFLDLHKTLSKERLRENDLVIITNCEDRGYLDAVVFLKLRDQLGEDKHEKQSRTVLVIRALVRGIPYIGQAVDAFLFGRN